MNVKNERYNWVDESVAGISLTIKPTTQIFNKFS